MAVNTKFLNSLQLEWNKYVTNVLIDYDDDYQGKAIQENSLTTAVMRLARAITQRYSTLTNNLLRTPSNTRNQVVVQADRVDIQSRNVRNSGRYVTRTTDNQGDYTRNTNVQKDTRNGNV
ncbi:hypothetical protein Tco_0783139 [Tanacetum coccineum]